MASTKHSLGGSHKERWPLHDHDNSEEHLSDRRNLHHGSSRSASLSNLGVALIVLVASAITAVSTVLLLRSYASHCYHIAPAAATIPQPHHAPSFDHQFVVFDPDKDFLGPPTPSSERAWQSLLPIGRGFVQASDREGNPPTQYSVAAFHQYHCVHLLQRIFHKAVDTSLSITPEDEEHFYHCVDYVRQTVMCLADPSLDAVTKDPDTPRRALNSGWGDTHVCRDFDALRKWTEDHRASNATFSESF